ncbi:hypothetical protein J6590_012650 [Homalodisca vitripennis]|nr:hypothetical protein J6590_012650 [Homalodisca vitripennis]
MVRFPYHEARRLAYLNLLGFLRLPLIMGLQSPALYSPLVGRYGTRVWAIHDPRIPAEFERLKKRKRKVDKGVKAIHFEIV